MNRREGRKEARKEGKKEKTKGRKRTFSLSKERSKDTHRTRKTKNKHVHAAAILAPQLAVSMTRKQQTARFQPQMAANTM